MSAPKTYVLDPFYVIGSICNSYLFLYIYMYQSVPGISSLWYIQVRVRMVSI